MNSRKAIRPWIRYWMFLICLAISAPQAKASDIANPTAPKELFLNQPQELVTPSPYKSPNTALLLSLGITLGSLGLGYGLISYGISSDEPGLMATGSTIGGLGILLGPSAGHFYSGETSRGLLTSLGRVAAFAVMASGSAMQGFFSEPTASEATTGILIGIGGLAYVGLTLWDIIDAPSSAKRFNEKAAKQRIVITPLIVPSQDPLKSSSNLYGLSLSGSF